MSQSQSIIIVIIIISHSLRKRTFWRAPNEDSNQSVHLPVWSESLLSAWRTFVSFGIQNAASEDSD